VIDTHIIAGIRFAARLSRGPEDAVEFPRMPEPPEINLLLHIAQHIGIPLGQLRRAIVVEREPRLLLLAQAGAPYRHDGVAVGIHHNDALDPGLCRGLDRGIAREHDVVLVHNYGAPGPNLTQRRLDHPDVPRGVASCILGIRGQVSDMAHLWSRVRHADPLVVQSIHPGGGRDPRGVRITSPGSMSVR